MFTIIVNRPDTKNKVDELTILFKNAAKKGYVNYEIIDSAISIGDKLFYIEGLGKAYQRKGLTARYNYDYYTAIENHKRALTYLEQTIDTIETIKCLNNIGVAYRRVNIEDKSFDYYFKAYKLSEKINLTSSQAIALNGIGNIFIDIKKYKTALYYFKKALQLEVSNNNKQGIEYDLANIGETNIYMGNYDSAKVYLERALQYAKQRKK
ncbi:MAG: hypothetical protein CR986_05510 [Ignavibacteriae bacterium]|nr:MAG: hypothetical protein CR986_05510 [Ignavibacteriota bacterium]